jgi:outer membrane protein assembly factor BamA
MESNENARTKFTKIRSTRKPFYGFVIFAIFVIFVLAFSNQSSAQERIAEIRVHGNHTTPDADVLDMSGLKVGDAATDGALEIARRQIRVSHRFSDVEIRRRYLSISDPTQVLIMIVVDERIGVSDTDLTPGFARRLRAASMFLPILNYQDGYGFTYGVRTTFPEVIDDNTRVSVPTTWGGERRIGVDVEHWFGGSRGLLGVGRSDPFLRLTGGGALYRRVNPYYKASDYRQEVRIRAEHPIASWLRVGAGAKTARVSFTPGVGLSPEDLAAADVPALLIPARIVERHDSFTADAIVDTRVDPTFPRDAIYASVQREQLRWDNGGDTPAPGRLARTSAGRWRTDVRGYVGVGGSAVFAVRTQFATSDAPLPPSEQNLLGGTESLRGYDAGTNAGDNLASVSTELRYPLTSPLNLGRFGVKGFVDWGTTWAHGSRFADATWQRGIGGGIFLGGGPVLLDMSLAWPQDGGPRFNMGFGVSF